MLQWITALERVAAASHYAGSNRFSSFAPIRLNVAAQWLVDGVPLFMIKLYIISDSRHSGITSGTYLAPCCLLGKRSTFMIGGYPQVNVVPSAYSVFTKCRATELQLRRPNKEKYRLDKLLERKAKEGVKIHIIL
jgi:phospholipase D1/2